MSQRLPKSKRLKSPKDFQRVYQNRQFGHTALFSFNVLGSNGNSLPKLGVTVSKKVSKNAVERNRLKRHIREFYRLRQESLCGAELIITAKPSAALKSGDALREELELLWTKVLKWQRWFAHQQAKENAKDDHG